MVIEFIEDYSRLSFYPTFLGVDLQNVSHVFREVDYDRFTNSLAGQTGTSTSGKNREFVFVCSFYDSDYVVRSFWYNYTNRFYLIYASVSAIKLPRHLIEANFTVN